MHDTIRIAWWTGALLYVRMPDFDTNWEAVRTMYYTSGWGALATTSIASVVVIVSATTSWITLRRWESQFIDAQCAMNKRFHAEHGERGRQQQREFSVDVLQAPEAVAHGLRARLMWMK
ncbi:hypothetical protein [Prescottella agglutinans]|jgi:hypothetical protein|uniref:Uncharacterized protein n=1 Tax=Prescottella agglutinans TaxID=1644129 RepID=A0ABT6MKU6_9NOCA|nr:hypothetical protein [Prescottella agglutinans]MDH6284925.1 hypothetical protein [Prescottella agglutinans]